MFRRDRPLTGNVQLISTRHGSFSIADIDRCHLDSWTSMIVALGTRFSITLFTVQGESHNILAGSCQIPPFSRSDEWKTRGVWPPMHVRALGTHIKTLGSLTKNLREEIGLYSPAGQSTFKDVILGTTSTISSRATPCGASLTYVSLTAHLCNSPIP